MFWENNDISRLDVTFVFLMICFSLGAVKPEKTSIQVAKGCW